MFVIFYHIQKYNTIYLKVVINMFQLKKEFNEYENKSLRLPKELINTINTLAEENNMSFNKVVIQCIEYALDNMSDQ